MYCSSTDIRQNPRNPARNVAADGLGWISEKLPDSGFAKGKIWYDPT